MAIHSLNLTLRYSDSITIMQQVKIIAAISSGSVLTSESIAEVYGGSPNRYTCWISYFVPLKQLEIARVIRYFKLTGKHADLWHNQIGVLF